MLKRKQVLLPDWMDQYLKDLAEVYNLSYSEVIRVLLSYSTIDVSSHIHPELSTDFDVRRIKTSYAHLISGKDDPEYRKQYTSELIYEAKKIIELRQKHLSEMKAAAKKRKN